MNRPALLLLVLLLLLSTGFVPVAGADDILGPPDSKTDKVVSDELESQILRMEKQVPMESTNYRRQYELANLYYDAWRLGKAEARYLRAIELNPKFSQAHVNLGSLYEDDNRIDEAIAQYEAALGIDPEDCKARSNLGNVYYSQNRFPDAMYEYKQAIKIDDKCYQAYFNMGVAFADAGIFREAIRYWREVILLAPGTEAARQAQQNVELLEPMVSGTLPLPRKSK